MWRQLSNYVNSVQTYRDLSPDIQVRYQINQGLRSHRQALTLQDWCQEFYRVTNARLSLLAFVHTCFQRYSGIDFSRVRPQDRLSEDLQFPLVCWFDWSLTFCDDFVRQFGIDISERFDEAHFATLADLIIFLDRFLR